ncbi:MAG: amidohydrolase family protein [Candidatus Korobacteraceae bacterium]|jgi:predicted TIM-barrel fold metal-dependent hydrolase
MMQKVIDSHFHFWRQQDLPWLTGPMVPRIFGPYESLRRDYSIEEFLADLAGSGIQKAVYVQANWAKDRFEDEVAWVQKTAEETGWPHAIVGYADMTVDDVRSQLDRLKRYRLVRGVRMQLHWHETPEYRFAPSASQILDPRVRKNVGRLKDYGFSFDLQIFPNQMRDGARLIEENPETDFILQHTGMLTDLSAETTAAWRSGLCQLAALPNLYSKLSAFGTFVHRNDPALIAYIVDNAITIFGSERLMFGSNFPIEKLWTGHSALMQAHRDAVAKHGELNEANIFWNTAARVYRI